MANFRISYRLAEKGLCGSCLCMRISIVFIGRDFSMQLHTEHHRHGNRKVTDLET